MQERLHTQAWWENVQEYVSGASFLSSFLLISCHEMCFTTIVWLIYILCDDLYGTLITADVLLLSVNATGLYCITMIPNGDECFPLVCSSIYSVTVSCRDRPLCWWETRLRTGVCEYRTFMCVSMQKRIHTPTRWENMPKWVQAHMMQIWCKYS